MKKISNKTFIEIGESKDKSSLILAILLTIVILTC